MASPLVILNGFAGVFCCCVFVKDDVWLRRKEFRPWEVYEQLFELRGMRGR